jgi:GNAT superfamily N-acetyltransferase
MDDQDVKNWTRKGFAIWFRDGLTGGVHLRRREDVHRICADLTFWVGRPFWGRGIARAAVRAATAYAFDILLLERVQTFVFDWTVESTSATEGPGYAEAARVLENAGYALEGRLHHYALKDGQYGDALLYARLNSASAPFRGQSSSLANPAGPTRGARGMAPGYVGDVAANPSRSFAGEGTRLDAPQPQTKTIPARSPARMPTHSGAPHAPHK